MCSVVFNTKKEKNTAAYYDINDTQNNYAK